MLKNSLRKTAQRIAYRLLLRDLPRPYEHVGGYCWRSELPRVATQAASRGAAGSSSLLMFEDRRYLGPPNSRRRHIETIGRGWYRHEGASVYFATSDNTNPNENGRSYAYSTSAWLSSRNSGAANNLLRRSTTEAAIAADIQYALAGNKYREACREFGIRQLDGLDVLELGPGPSCAWSLLMACCGARVSVVDPYPAAWDASYHPMFFSALRTALEGSAETDVTPLSRLLDAGEFSSQVLQRHADPVEQLELCDESFDMVFSNAVGEHFYDSRAAFAQLHRVTRPGGWGFHWIDFRDHRDFASPLEYLLLSDAEFAREFGLRRGEIGNRLRADEMAAVIEQAGFEIVSRQPTIMADAAYLQDFLPRLRRCRASRYRDIGREKLQVLGERFVIRRPA